MIKEKPSPSIFEPAQSIATSVLPEDEKLWVPYSDSVWYKPLMFNTVNGQWIDVLRVRRQGTLSRHRHLAPVHGYVIKGKWRYLEHDWVASAGMYVFEPPGEPHTLVVDDTEEMITLFNLSGGVVFLDEKDNAIGFEDVFVKIEHCRRYYEQIGLDKDYVNQFIR